MMVPMGRWEPDGQRRLIVAAVDLFAEKGYEATTVNEIAQRAGLTKTTFFRHFRDKREVLFVGQEPLSKLLADGIAEAPDAATPLEAIAAGLDAATGVFRPEQREFGPRMQQVIADSPELRERAAFKHASFAEAMAEALRKRGVPELTATLAGDLGAHAFDHGYRRWVAHGAKKSYPKLAREALEELREAAVELS